MRTDFWKAHREAALPVADGLRVEIPVVGEGERPVMRAWRGKAEKPFSRYSYKDSDALHTHLATLVKEHKEMMARKAARKLASAVTPSVMEKIQVGTILSYSWGYDQTNVDFVEVVEVKGKSVIVQEIKDSVTETGFMCGKAVPLPGAFTGKRMLKRVQSCEGVPYLKMDYGHATIWNGRPEAISWYA